MPKRAKAAQAQQHEEPKQYVDAEEEQLNGEDLDLSSDEELADDEAVEGSSEGEEQSGDETDSADNDIQEALAEYLEAATAERPADAVGDGEPAETSGRAHKGSAVNPVVQLQWCSS
eukprot:GHUV01033216.1.p2 GENE.GHUV01033216.1~~GHUV01033216.1.p2  ORF type:complete len:117 (+),score=28.73 GHUV01033216.1:315-665(+)